MSLLLSCGGAMLPASDAADAGESQANVYPMVEPGRKLVFPRDHGAHPDYRTEWWYITGWIENDGVARGFQVTFFRSRSGLQEDNDSAFAPKQLIFAHAAIADAIRLFSPEYVKLIVAKNGYFKVTPKQEAEDSFSVRILMGFHGQMINKNPRRSAVLYNFNS